MPWRELSSSVISYTTTLPDEKDSIFLLCFLCLSRLAVQLSNRRKKVEQWMLALLKIVIKSAILFHLKCIQIWPWWLNCLFLSSSGPCAANTRVIKQSSLQKFQEEMDAVKKDPYRVVMRQSKLPMSLLHDRVKAHVCMPISTKFLFSWLAHWFKACVWDTEIAALHPAAYYIKAGDSDRTLFVGQCVKRRKNCQSAEYRYK